MAEFPQRLRLDLADAFAGDVKLLADLLERPALAVLQPEPEAQNLRLPGGQGFEDVVQLLPQEGVGGGVDRRRGVVVGDEVAQVAVLLLADRGLEGDRLLAHPQDLPHLIHRHIQLVGDLLGAGLMAVGVQQLAGDLLDPVDRLDHVHRDADGAGLVGNRAGDRLADPPGGVGRELKALGVVELLDRLDEAEVPLLDEVQKLHPPPDIPFGDRDDQPQVGFA